MAAALVSGTAANHLSRINRITNTTPLPTTSRVSRLVASDTRHVRRSSFSVVEVSENGLGPGRGGELGRMELDWAKGGDEGRGDEERGGDEGRGEEGRDDEELAGGGRNC